MKVNDKLYSTWMALPIPPNPKKVYEDKLPDLISKYSILFCYSTEKKKQQVLSTYTQEEQYKYLYNKYQNMRNDLKKAGYNVEKKLSTVVMYSEIKNHTKLDGNEYVNWICENGECFETYNLSIEVLTKFIDSLTIMADNAKIVLDCKLEEKKEKDLQIASLEAQIAEMHKQLDELKMSA